MGHRQMAPHPNARSLGCRPVRRLAAPAGIRPVLRIHAGRDRPVPPGALRRQPPSRRPPNPRGGLPRHRRPSRPRNRPGPDPTHDGSGTPVFSVPGLWRYPRPPPGTGHLPREVAGTLRRGVGRSPSTGLRTATGHGRGPTRDGTGPPQPRGGGVGGPLGRRT